MGRTLDLGRRVELVSMDAHFHNITIGLYRSGETYRIHTYSQVEGSAKRIQFLIDAAVVLGGMDRTPDGLRFPCGSPHLLAARRIFLEACKLQPEASLAIRPLTILDKKSGSQISVRSLGGGRYELTAEPPDAARVEAIAAGLQKLAELDSGSFSCGMAHDSTIGLLLPRALNVRAILREEEMAASRGTLVAPSAQK